MLAKKTSKNQLTLPKGIVEHFPETEYFDIRVEGRKIVLSPVKMAPVGRLDEIRDKMERLGIEPGDVPGAVKWARKKKK